VRERDGNRAEQQRLQGSVIYRAVIRVRVKQIFAVVPSPPRFALVPTPGVPMPLNRPQTGQTCVLTQSVEMRNRTKVWCQMPIHAATPPPRHFAAPLHISSVIPCHRVPFNRSTPSAILPHRAIPGQVMPPLRHPPECRLEKPTRSSHAPRGNARPAAPRPVPINDLELFSFPRSAWERTPGRSAVRPCSLAFFSSTISTKQTVKTF